MKSGERWFWIAFVLGMFMSRVFGGLGVMHRIWPERFDPPSVGCERAAVGEGAVPYVGQREVAGGYQSQSKG